MKAVNALPEGYKEIDSIDLQKDKKLSFLVNMAAILISALLIVPMHFVLPISTMFDMSKGLGNYFVRFLSLLVLTVV